MRGVIDEHAETPHRHAAGSVAAFLSAGLFVKYAELLLTPEHYALIPVAPGLHHRAAQAWLWLRFSWQEFAIAAALLAAIAASHHHSPQPGAWTRRLLQATRGLLAALSLLGVLGIAYYALYQTHVTAADARYLGWLAPLLASTDVLSLAAVQWGLATWLAATVALPWLAARIPIRAAALFWLTSAILGVTAVGTWAAGRPNLAEALLEPDPALWLLTGHRVAFVDLPAPEAIEAIGATARRYTPTERPRNIVLVILESTPAAALFPYDSASDASRTLVDQFGQDLTVFENVYGVVPNSTASLFSVLKGRSPLPDTETALSHWASEPTLAELLKARGAHAEFLHGGLDDPFMLDVVRPGFDRLLAGQDDWPTKGAYARLAWGYDDRMLFDEAARFLRRQTPDSPPFFLVLYANNPHVPYESQRIPGLGGSDDPRQRHRRLVKYDMDLLTEMYASMRASKLADSTAILAYGDHGEAFEEHPSNRVHGNYLFDENVHVPLLLLHPGRFGLPARISQIGSLNDILPTAFDLLGIGLAPRAGMSLLFEAPARMILSVTTDGPGQLALRDQRFTYLLSRNGREWLLDRRVAPGKRADVLDAFRDVAARFRSRLGLPPAER